MTKVSHAEAFGAAMVAIANDRNKDLEAAGVRTSLEWLAQEYPGRSVEVRVPPIKAVQILGGTTHRRGTPPAVVEMSPKTWLELFTNKLTWEQAVATGQVIASGERSDLSEILERTSSLD